MTFMPDSNIFWLTLKAVIGALVLFDVYVSIRLIFYSGYTGFQKVMQFLIIWLLPLFGALLAHSLMVVPRHIETDHGFNRDDGDNPPGIKSSWWNPF
jgi:hypothetical protein